MLDAKDHTVTGRPHLSPKSSIIPRPPGAGQTSLGPSLGEDRVDGGWPVPRSVIPIMLGDDVELGLSAGERT